MGIAKNVAKALGKGTLGASGYAAKGADAMASVVATPTVWAGEKAMRGMVKKTDRAIWNGYTGFRESPLAIGAATAVGGGYAYSKIVTNDKEQLKQLSTTEYNGTAPIMQADGVGNRTSAPTLGASGSLVLGLNAGRRG